MRSSEYSQKNLVAWIYIATVTDLEGSEQWKHTNIRRPCCRGLDSLARSTNLSEIVCMLTDKLIIGVISLRLCQEHFDFHSVKGPVSLQLAVLHSR